jgi:spermidine/putrescine transport system substrate-binding protein
MNYRKLTNLMGLAVLLALALLVAACAAPATAPAAEEGADAAQEAAADVAPPERCGDPELLDDRLNFFNWADYIDENILTQFEEECGVEVVMDNYTTNEELIAKIQAGNSGYDVVVPTDYAVSIMADQGLLAELDKSLIPNEANLSADTMAMYYDETNTYSLPYQWSTTGLAYNATAFPDGAPTSWSAVFDPEQLCENRGFVSMLDDPRETIGKALLYLGYDVNESDPAAQEEAKDLLLAQKDCIAGYNSENYIQNLASEEVVMAESWGFAAALARSENENIFYVIPDEGGTIWQDNLAVPADAPHPYTAHVFINYLLEPDIGAQLTEWTFGFTPNAAAEELLSDDYYALMREGGMLPDEELFDRLSWIERSPGTEIFNDTWTSVKAQ